MANTETLEATGRTGWWLAGGLVLTLVVLDFFYGSLTRPLVLGQAKVAVVSDPPGAVVYADTKKLGETPLVDGKVLPGSYVLRIEHPHFEPVREPISVARGGEVRRSLELVPARGSLSLVSNPRGAAIRLNGELLTEVTPATLEDRVAGVYEVELSIEGRKAVTEQLDVKRGQTASLNAELNRVPMARLTLDVQPENATIELSGTSLGYADGMRLVPGSYQVKVTQPGFAAQEQTLELRRGPNRFSVELQRQFGVLNVRATPAAARVTYRAHGKSTVYSEPVELPTGTVRLTARAPGYRVASKTLDLTQDGAEIVINLEQYKVEAGRVFDDRLASGGRGPQLVVIAAGAFDMGDTTGKGAADEKPVHRVELNAPFALGVREISRDEWLRQFQETSNAEAEEGDLPQTKVTREQITAYLRWLSAESGERYRLPSEAEWEYAARAGSNTLLGGDATKATICSYANVADASFDKVYPNWAVLPCTDGYVRFAPTGSFAPNALGLYDMLGNASEWLADCWHDNYKGAPRDGVAWGKKCNAYVSRGGSWDTVEGDLRVSFRTRVSREGGELGLRVVREL